MNGLIRRVLSQLRAARVDEDSAIQWGEVTPWTPIATVEGDWSEYPVAERLTAQILSETASTFDPDVRRVPLVAGFVKGGMGGSGHWDGRLLPPPGRVVDVDFDGFVLWARFQPIIDQDGTDRLSHLISQGFTERSVMIFPQSAVVDGQAQLEHVAILAMGETPGIPNMPPLDTWLAEWSRTSAERSAWRAVAAAEGDDTAGQLRREWDYFGGLSANLAANLETSGRAMTRSFDIIPPEDQPATEEPEMDPEQLRAMIQEAIAPVVEQVTGLVARVDALQATVEEMKPPIEESAPEPEIKAAPETPAVDPAIAEEARAAVVDAVRAGQIPPAEMATRIADLTAGGRPAIAAFQRVIRSLPPVVQSQAVEICGDNGATRFVSIELPAGMAARYSFGDSIQTMALAVQEMQRRGIADPTKATEKELLTALRAVGGN